MTLKNRSFGFSIWPIIFIILLLATIFLVGYISFSGSGTTSQTAEIKAATLLPKPKALSPNLALTDHNNQPFSIEQLKGHWSILFFGYTSCPDVCPTQMTILKQLVSHPKINNKPQALLVSVDPERDTAEKLKSYVQAFNPAFIGITAKDKTELERFSRELGVYYEYVETVRGVSQDHSKHNMHNHEMQKEEKKDYEVNHTASFILINPNGEYAALFTSPYNVDDMVKAYNEMTQ